MKPTNQPIVLSIILIILILPIPTFGQFEEFANSFDLLSTIAGKGESDDRSAIGWKPEFENGNAVDAELTRPHYAMADSAGNIYIADKDAHAIRKVTTNGKIQTIAGTNVAGDNGDGVGVETQLNAPNGIWVSADGRVYILDLGNNKIRHLNTSGKIETIVDDTNGIGLGRGLWLTQAEDSIFYASGSQIKLWTALGGVQTYASGFSGLGNICMDSEGLLVVTDRSANLVYRIGKDGTKAIIAGNGSQTGGGTGFSALETGLHGVRGVWFLEDNTYFLATHEGSQIWYVDASGIIHLFLDGRDGDDYHSGDGENYRTPGYKISEPRSVSIDYEGNVLIVENDKGFVRKIEKNKLSRISKQNLNIQEINVYPNPAQAEVFFSYGLKISGEISFSLHNNLGEEFIRISEFQNAGIQILRIGIADLPNGIYYLTISIAKTHEIKKIAVIK